MTDDAQIPAGVPVDGVPADAPVEETPATEVPAPVEGEAPQA
jgi:hypothetical protein